jgi:hypothetical protein
VEGAAGQASCRFSPSYRKATLRLAVKLSRRRFVCQFYEPTSFLFYWSLESGSRLYELLGDRRLPRHCYSKPSAPTTWTRPVPQRPAKSVIKGTEPAVATVFDCPVGGGSCRPLDCIRQHCHSWWRSEHIPRSPFESAQYFCYGLVDGATKPGPRP